VRHADGSWRWFETTGRPYLTGGELRVVSIARDVTDERIAEAEQLRLQAHMQEVQRLESLGVLAGGIAHDFNNLLAVVLGNASLLEAGAGSPAEAAERLRRIQAAARHAEALTDQMLTYAGRSVAALAPLSLSALVRDTEDLLLAAISKKCRLRLELAEDLPPVQGDPTRLRQVLMNLVTNAAEAQGEGGGEVRVRTRLAALEAGSLAGAYGAAERRPGPWVLLEVADDGPGIADAQRPRIFEPFFSTKGVGRGLGLAAVLGIASAHRGLVQVESAPGRGTTFRLLLPPGEQVRSEAPAGAPTAELAAPEGLVLVVDDDEAVRETAQALLEHAGFRVEAVAGGREAITRVRAGGVDAVLLDLVMPDLAGGEVLRVLAAEQPELPVVVASGYRRELVQLEGEGAFGFVQKPFDPERLAALLRDALRKRAARRAAR
jgi:signal transduction histidine kinase/CheY-like chemotaxis protein